MNGETKAAAIQAHLEKLAKNGRLTPDRVVADAKRDASPLHESFEWDDRKAGHLYRIEQARDLIASVEVQFVRDNKTYSAPAWVRDPNALAKEQGYVQTVVIADEKTVARSALLNEASRAAAYLARVRALAVALNLDAEVDAIVDRFTEFRDRAAAA